MYWFNSEGLSWPTRQLYTSAAGRAPRVPLLPKLEPILMEKIDWCCQRVEELYTIERPVKVEEVLMFLTIGIVSRFYFSQSSRALSLKNFVGASMQVCRAICA